MQLDLDTINDFRAIEERSKYPRVGSRAGLRGAAAALGIGELVLPELTRVNSVAVCIILQYNVSVMDFANV